MNNLQQQDRLADSRQQAVQQDPALFPIPAPGEKLEEAIKAVDAGVREDIKRELETLSPAEIADLLESTPPHLRVVILELIQKEEEFSHILSQLDPDVRNELLKGMNFHDLASAVHDLDTDDFVDILQQLPEAISDQILTSLDAANRQRLEKVLSYPKDSAGGMMNTDTITVKPHHPLKLISRYLRQHKKVLPNMTDNLIVVSESGKYLGLLPLMSLVISSPKKTAGEVMETRQSAINCLLDEHEVTQIFIRDELISAPVVDEKGQLLGRITVDDAVDVMIEQADQSLSGLLASGSEQDAFAPLPRTVRSRSIWLGINLMTACVAAVVISFFEASISEVVALAVLLPVVASMGGIAGTQTLTLVVRGMALNHIVPANLHWVIGRELLLGILNGLLWSALIGLGVGLLFSNVELGAVAAAAILITLTVAALAGVTLPSLLNRVGIDPALAGSVILTTVTDVTGFLSFLGLATLFFF